jgi:hypothetical protein
MLSKYPRIGYILPHVCQPTGCWNDQPTCQRRARALAAMQRRRRKRSGSTAAAETAAMATTMEMKATAVATAAEAEARWWRRQRGSRAAATGSEAAGRRQ